MAKLPAAVTVARRTSVRLAFSSLLILLIAVILYSLVGHTITNAMYEGRSIGILNAIIRGQEEHSLEFYHRLADQFFVTTCLSYFIISTLIIAFYVRKKIADSISFDAVFRVYVLAAISSVAISISTYFLLPNLRGLIIGEDRLLESSSAVLFLATFVIGLALALQVNEKRQRRVYFVVPLIGLLGFLEELSYGERIFDITMPQIYDVKVDALHDLIRVGLKILESHSSIWIRALLVFLVGALIVVTIMKRRAIRSKIANTLQRYPAFRLVLLGTGLIITSLVLDLPLTGKHHSLFLLEELIEMNAALALVAASYTIGLLGRSTAESPKHATLPEPTSPSV